MATITFITIILTWLTQVFLIKLMFCYTAIITRIKGIIIVLVFFVSLVLFLQLQVECSVKIQDNQGVTESRETCKVQYEMFIVKIAEGAFIVPFVGN